MGARAVAAGGALCLLLAAITVGGVGAQSPATPGNYYVALGDSLGVGITAPGVTTDPQCQVSTTPAYVCRVYGYLKQLNPALQLQNLSIPEMGSCVLIHGTTAASDCPGSAAPPGVASPLQAALQFIAAHPGEVNPVTINVGGADLVPLLPAAVTDPYGTAAKLPALLTQIQTSLDTALKELRSALGPDPEIVLITQYNPLGGLTAPPLPAGLPDVAKGAINGLNKIEVGVAAKYGVRVADVASAFDAYPGGAALLTFVPPTLAAGDPSRIDIYPTLDGYRRYAQTVLKATGYAAPARVKVKLTRQKIHQGTHGAVLLHTVSGASLKITVALPKVKAKTFSGVADNNGVFLRPFSVGGRKGRGTVHVCETDAVTSRSMCSKTYRFVVG